MALRLLLRTHLGLYGTNPDFGGFGPTNGDGWSIALKWRKVETYGEQKTVTIYF